MHLVFFEDREQVLNWMEDDKSYVSARLIAITAEALQALEERNLPHEPISAYAEFRPILLAERQFCHEVVELGKEIETFIGARCDLARFDGPGFVSENAYYLRCAMLVVAARSHLMREVIRACSPSQVTILSGQLNTWFQDDGYTQNPWLDVLQGRRANPGSGLPSGFKGAFQCSSNPASVLPSLARRDSELPGNSKNHYNPSKLRLLLAHSRVYDWAAVLPDLLADAEVQCFAIEGSFAGLRDWLYYYKPFLHDVGQDGGRDLGIGPPKVTAKELADLAVLFDDWERSRPEPPTLKVLGLDLYPALRNYLKSMVVQMPTLVRHTDAVALRALEVCQPDAVCFFAMPWLPTKRLAFHARQRGIPSVCYQHGACYGTHDVPSHALTEMAHADYFLSYGDGIVPPPNPCLPTRAKYVPVGSARLEALRLHSSSRGPLPFLTALWIGEVSLKNTNGPLEDTKRYLMQRKCLEILGQAAKLRVIYRPFPGELAAQATPRWLELARLPSISVEPNQSLANLMLASDLIICDSTSCNAFNEGVALNKPTILYLDPTQILLLPHFIEDLERACLWCKTDDALINAVRRLAKDPHPFVEELRRIDTTTFMNKYMLHRGGEPCARRVISFLKNVCRDGRSLKQREPMNSATSPGVHTLSDVLSRLNQRLQ